MCPGGGGGAGRVSVANRGIFGGGGRGLNIFFRAKTSAKFIFAVTVRLRL